MTKAQASKTALAGEKAVEILHPITSEPVTVFLSGVGQLWTMRFECGSTALLPATSIRRSIKIAKAWRARHSAQEVR